MRTLVIGGSRNLGPGLVAALLARGDAVTVLNRGISEGAIPFDTPGSAAPPVEHLRADRTSASALAAALRNRAFDAVVDTTLYTGADARAAVGILGDRVGRYVWWSTGQVYLVRTGPVRPFRESDYHGPLMAEPPAAQALDHRNWEYGVGKRAAEDTFRTAFETHGFPAVSLRMPMINSERDHYTRIAGYVHRLLDGGPIVAPAEGEPPLRHVYGQDVIAATIRALDASATAVAGKAFNISQDETLTLADMLRRLAELLDANRDPATGAGSHTPTATGTGAATRVLRVPRTLLEARGLLPACSPFSDPWMSSLTNEEGKHALNLQYTPVDSYLPRCVTTAREVPAAAVRGYSHRREELELLP